MTIHSFVIINYLLVLFSHLAVLLAGPIGSASEFMEEGI